MEVTLVKDIHKGMDGSFPHNITDVNGTVFFTASTDGQTLDLWKSDGTEVSTQLIRDFNFEQQPEDLINIDGTLFFITVNHFNGQRQLWSSDGTELGTLGITLENSISQFGSPSSLTELDGTLFFIYNQGLWKSDGTVAGTQLVQEASRDENGDLIGRFSNLVNLNGTLFFRSTEGLWRSDGTEVGTQLIQNGLTGSITLLDEVDGTLYFEKNNGLWKSDGTSESAELVKEFANGFSLVRIDDGRLNPVVNLDAPIPTLNDGTFFLVADDGVHGEELWKAEDE